MSVEVISYIAYTDSLKNRVKNAKLQFFVTVNFPNLNDIYITHTPKSGWIKRAFVAPGTWEVFGPPVRNRYQEISEA